MFSPLGRTLSVPSLVSPARSFRTTPTLLAGRQGVNNKSRPKVKKKPHVPEGHVQPWIWKKIKAVHRGEELKRKFDLIKDVPVIHMKVVPLQSWVLNLKGEPVGMLDMPKEVWGKEIRTDIVHRVVRWQRNRWRQGTHMTKTRAEKSGGGRKPRPQKGTGQARMGSIRSPLNQGGGQSHAKRNRNYSFKLSDKVLKLGMATALSAKFQENNMYIIKDTLLDSHKTGHLADLLKEHWSHIEPGEIAVLSGEAELDNNFALAARNLWNLDFYTPKTVNVYDLVKRHHLMITETAVREMYEQLEKPDPRSKVKFVTDMPIVKLADVMRFKVRKVRRHLLIARRNAREKKELAERKVRVGKYNGLDKEILKIKALYAPRPTGDTKIEATA